MIELLRKPLWNVSDFLNYCNSIGIKCSRSKAYKMLRTLEKNEYLKEYYNSEVVLTKIFNTTTEKEFKKLGVE